MSKKGVSDPFAYYPESQAVIWFKNILKPLICEILTLVCFRNADF